jgi:hypothetical protein
MPGRRISLIDTGLSSVPFHVLATVIRSLRVGPDGTLISCGSACRFAPSEMSDRSAPVSVLTSTAASRAPAGLGVSSSVDGRFTGRGNRISSHWLIAHWLETHAVDGSPSIANHGPTDSPAWLSDGHGLDALVLRRHQRLIERQPVVDPAVALVRLVRRHDGGVQVPHLRDVRLALLRRVRDRQRGVLERPGVRVAVEHRGTRFSSPRPPGSAGSRCRRRRA